MKKRLATRLFAIVLAGLILSACFGNFSLTRTVYKLNSNVENAYVRSAVTWVFVILPVYVIPVILLVPIARNEPKGQLQSVALAILGFVYLGWMFGHISFMGVGAYTTALLTIPTGFKATHLPNLPSPLSFLYDVELSFWMALLVAGCVTAIGGALIGVPLMRLDGLQAALATIAVLVIVNTVLREWETVTRGTTAMLGIPTDTTLGIATFGALVTIVVAWLFATSRWGLRLQASRDDPLAADSLGINTFKERMIAFTISAFFAGAGGVLWAHLLGTLAPTMFFWGITFSTVAMLIIGGIKSLAGAVIGAIAVSLLSEGLRRVEIGGLGPIPPPPTGLTQAGLALVLIVILLIRQRGITGGREVPMPSRLRQWALRG